MSDKLTGKEIRDAFIKFFSEKHNHNVVKSSSLIPDNPTVLLTTAGMLQFMPIFLGYEAPPEPPRVVTCQKCARAGGKDSDIENVGRTPRHHTFFEMLGNFSFGDYYKEEIIPWSWDFVTNYLNLDKDRLWITIFETDDEAFDIWHNKVGVPKERILRKGKKDNFWGPPGISGSCGPCSEIHYDLGKELACSSDCGIDTCECDRWVEIWNLVFTELFQDEEGNQTPLERKNVDTGMGLERITMVVNDKMSTFETDLLKPILDKVCELAGKKYKESHKTDVSLRIITDHVRCVTFMIADGLTPSNEGRNYVLRMIMRRALRHGKILGMELPFLYKLVDVVVENYCEIYPELSENKEKIISTIKKEEDRFKLTLDKGQGHLDDLISKAKSSDKVIKGDDAFKLYDTFGFPLELTVEIAAEEDVKVDVDGFNAAMKEQKVRAKNAQVKVSLTDDLIYVEASKTVSKTLFTGYSNKKETDCVVKSIIKNNQLVQEAHEGDDVEIILDKTPFYAESGGQVGDIGIISNNSFKADVSNTTKFDGLFVHKAKVVSGSLTVGDVVFAQIDEKRRQNITIQHSTAHLLQSALKIVLGDEVAQAGSQVEPDRTRFDFTFDRAMTQDEVQKVENIINEWIEDDLKQNTIEMTLDEAKNSGAMALFGEKYEDKVRVVSIAQVSKELCGGTHIKSTGEIRLAKITTETAIAAGVRRIEIICGAEALNYLVQKEQLLYDITQVFKCAPSDVISRIEKLIEDNKQSQKALKSLETTVAAQKIDSVIEKAVAITDGKLLVARVDGIAADVLKTSVEKISGKLGDSIVVLASVCDDKITIVAKVSDNFVKNGVNAGKIVNDIASKCEGRGGGRPNFAQAGAKNPAQLDDALNSIVNDFK